MDFSFVELQIFGKKFVEIQFHKSIETVPGFRGSLNLEDFFLSEEIEEVYKRLIEVLFCIFNNVINIDASNVFLLTFDSMYRKPVPITQITKLIRKKL